jgi:hypothetical protein
VRRVHAHQLAWALALAAVGTLIVPAAAHASVLGDVHPTFGLFGISIKDVVGKIIKSLVGLVVPDFADHWATDVVTWLVAIPNLAVGYASLNQLRADLMGVGIGIAGICFTTAGLEYLAAGVFSSSPFRAVGTFGRTVVSVGLIVFTPKLMSVTVVGVNLFTAELIGQRVVREGINEMLGGALVIAAVAGALSLGLTAGAVLVACYFLAGLFIFKIGDTSVLAVLYVASAVGFGFYPLTATRWIARSITAGIGAALAVPVVWSLIFATSGVLGRDALLWHNPSVPGGGLTPELQSLAKPFAAVTCLYVAYKAPSFLVSLARSVGVSPAGVFSGGMIGGGGRGGGGARGGGRFNAGAVAARGAQRAGDRFRGLRVAAGRMTGQGAGYAGVRAQQLRNQAAGRAQRAAGKSVVQLAGATSPKIATDALAAGDGLAAAGRKVGRGAAAGKRGADWWRKKAPAEGARHRHGGATRAGFAAGRQTGRANATARAARTTAPRRAPRPPATIAGGVKFGGRDRRIPSPRRVPPGVVARAAGRPALPPRGGSASGAGGDRRTRDARAGLRAPRGPRDVGTPSGVALQPGTATGRRARLARSPRPAVSVSNAARPTVNSASTSRSPAASGTTARAPTASAKKPPAASSVASPRGGAASGRPAVAGPAKGRPSQPPSKARPDAQQPKQRPQRAASRPPAQPPRPVRRARPRPR